MLVPLQVAHLHLSSTTELLNRERNLFFINAVVAEKFPDFIGSLQAHANHERLVFRIIGFRRCGLDFKQFRRWIDGWHADKCTGYDVLRQDAAKARKKPLTSCCLAGEDS